MCNLWCWAFSPRKLFNLPPVFGLLWLVPGPPRGGHHASLEECDGAGPDLILIGLLRGAALFHTFGWSCTVSILLLLRYYSYSYTSLEPRLSSDGGDFVREAIQCFPIRRRAAAWQGCRQRASLSPRAHLPSRRQAGQGPEAVRQIPGSARLQVLPRAGGRGRGC